jgi:hypothetical protein
MTNAIDLKNATKAQRIAKLAQAKFSDAGLPQAIAYLRRAITRLSGKIPNPGYYSDLILPLLPPALSNAYKARMETLEKAREKARTKYAEKAAEWKKQTRERYEYIERHPERFVYVAILTHSEDDPNCYDPRVFVGREHYDVDDQLAEFMGVDLEDIHECFDRSDSGWQLIYCEREEIHGSHPPVRLPSA